MSTVAAISTPHAVGGISVIRISGENALSIADEVFSPVTNGKKPSGMEGYTCAYGRITDGKNILDDGIITVFRAPHSYTGENVAEISCHGGIFVTEQILRLVISKGAVPAEAGEFTKRAFLNGKMNLTQAESVMDIISANGKAELRCASALREGALFKRINKISSGIIALLGSFAAWVDYPDDDIPAVTNEEIFITLNNAISQLDQLLSSYDSGKIIRKGIDTVIAGKPNVGKSTLMNLLSGCERSIVTDIAGTTRDIVEESVRVGDIVLRLSDTAGIRSTDDKVETIGVDIAKKKIETAELILAVFDLGTEISDEDISIAESCKGKNAIAILNKSDLERKFDFSEISENFKDSIVISAGSGDGIEMLSEAIEKIYRLGEIVPDAGILVNERQRVCAEKARISFSEALSALKDGATLDAVNILIDSGENFLLELTGEKVSEAVVNEVFSHFCVGK